jgi:hypothetical protein
MPEFILPEEGDRCPYCDAVLYYPPNCCKEIQQEYQDMEKENFESLLDNTDYGCYIDERHGR